MAIDPILLAAAIEDCKREESRAREKRSRLELELIGAVGFEKSEGQETFEPETDLGSAKIICKQPVNTRVDQDYLQDNLEILPKVVQAILRIKYEIDTKAARKLQEEDKEAWAIASSFISRKPGKVQVTIEDLITPLSW